MYKWIQARELEKVALARGSVTEWERICKLPSDIYVRFYRQAVGNA